MRNIARPVHESARSGFQPFAVAYERHVPVQHIEALVLSMMRMIGRGKFPGISQCSIIPNAPFVVSPVALVSVGTPIPLPEGAQEDQARAQFNDGVLQVSVPVPKSATKGREIPIEK
jgi:hypothetical protein